MKVVLAAILVFVLVSGCTQQQQQGQQKTQALETQENANQVDGEKAVGEVKSVALGDIIEAEYVGRFTDGTVFDQSAGRGPLEFVAGSGQMIKGFDEGVIGMKLNDEKTVTIPPEKAYGTEGSGEQVVLPLASISKEGNLKVGSRVSTGTGRTGTVIDISNENATIEFNHPLAGKTLVFWIKVVKIQKK